MFWNNVKSELEYQGLTQKELSERTGISLGTIKNQLCRNVMPNTEYAFKIAKALNVTVEYLMTGNNLPGLNDDEMEVLRLYKQLNEPNKAMVKQLISALSIEK